MVKQKYLYHASPFSNLKSLHPKSRTAPQGFKEGPVIFATDNFGFATQFLVHTDDSWTSGGVIGGTLFFVISDKARFTKADKGGSVYLVSSKTFQKYNEREYFSRETINVKAEVCFNSALMAMIINDVQVFYVNKNTFNQIKKSKDHGCSILNKTTSENEKFGLPRNKLDIYKGSQKLVGVNV